MAENEARDSCYAGACSCAEKISPCVDSNEEIDINRLQTLDCVCISTKKIGTHIAAALGERYKDM